MVKKMNENQEIKFSKVWTEFLEYKRKMVEGGKITVATFKKYEWLYNRYVKDTNLDQYNLEELTTPKLEESILEMVKENELKKSVASNIICCIRQALDYAYQSNDISKDLTNMKEILGHKVTTNEKHYVINKMENVNKYFK